MKRNIKAQKAKIVTTGWRRKPRKPRFNAMKSLPLDGKMVRLNSEAGEYTALALPGLLTDDTFASLADNYHKPWGRLPDGSFGYWPDPRFTPTGWRKL